MLDPFQYQLCFLLCLAKNFEWSPEVHDTFATSTHPDFPAMKFKAENASSSGYHEYAYLRTYRPCRISIDHTQAREWNEPVAPQRTFMCLTDSFQLLSSCIFRSTRGSVVDVVGFAPLPMPIPIQNFDFWTSVQLSKWMGMDGTRWFPT